MHPQPLWPLVLYFFAVIAVISAMLIIPSLLGQRHKERSTGIPYESGAVSTSSSQIHFFPHFYLIGMLFVIFDLEAVFIFAWAIAFRKLGWAGYLEIVTFIGVLFIALIYVWRMGVLDGIRKPSHAEKSQSK
jgi:NADH-quinone oxidoreductase subunit A